MFRRSRDAFTLVELLIVLAVVAALAAMSWPAVRGLFARSQVHSAAKQVRAALAGTRVDAIESGTVRQFRYQPDTGRFEVSVFRAAAGTAAPPRRETAEEEPSGRPLDAEPTKSHLPSGVRFEAARDDELLGGDDPASLPAEESWSAPVLFFPNGRTSNAKFQLCGRSEWTVELSLRGATGTVTIGTLYQPEPWP